LQSLTPEVIEHARAGTAAQQQGQLDVAIEEFRKVTELQPNSASGYANLGNAYFLKGDYGAAIPQLEQALKLNPKLMGTHQALGVALLLQGDATGALPHFEETRAPDLLGLAYLETGRYGSALMALKAALDRQANDPDLLYYFGRAAKLAGQRAQQQLGKLKPGLAQAKQESAARDVFTLETALAKQPNDPALLFEFQQAAAAASEQAFEKILKTDADSARAHQVAAERNLAAGMLRQAEYEYAQALRLRPYTAGVHLAFGNVLADAGNLPQAILQFQAEVELRPADPGANYRLGTALLQQGRSADAVKALETADKLRPNTPPILLDLAKAAQAAKDNAKAEKCWLQLLNVDQKSDFAAQAHFALAALYKDAGKNAEADREMAAYQNLRNTGGGN
jgi:tetratricopeptide (TPR) repeat protein